MAVRSKTVYIKVTGTDEPIRAQADQVEKRREAPASPASGGYLLVIKKGGQQAGEFLGSIVQGWWIQDE